MRINYHCEALPFVLECAKEIIKDLYVEARICQVSIEHDLWDRNNPQDDEILTFMEGYIKIIYDNSNDQDVDMCYTIAQYLHNKGFVLTYYSCKVITFVYNSKQPNLPFPSKEQLKALIR